MSRAGYTDEFDERYPNATALYRQRVRNAVRGKRGQAFLRELGDALDAMPEKKLAARTVAKDGDCCALGCVALRRGVDLAPITYTDADDEECDGDWTTEWLRDQLGIPDCLAREIVYENDECGPAGETPAQRWVRVRSLVAKATGGAS